MPTLYQLNSIKIDIYSREHPPPHFHAIYAEHEILIEIENLQTYAGYMPKKQHKMIIDWASDMHVKKILETNFFALNPNLKR
ncbi:MAG: DUF4160 domain-containing protein [Chitinophagaceae bacterium]